MKLRRMRKEVQRRMAAPRRRGRLTIDNAARVNPEVSAAAAAWYSRQYQATRDLHDGRAAMAASIL